MAVIRPEISTDPAELEEIAFEYLREAFPEWEPADGDLMTWLIGAHARMVAEERDIAADVPIEQILRPLGEEVHRIIPRVAAPATVRATVSVRDDKGYTIPRGTEVLVRTAGDDGVTMEVAAAVTVRSGVLTAPVTLSAIAGREGTVGNGLTTANEVVPIRPLEFIASIEIVEGEMSNGGADAETDEQYLQRLVDALALTSPVPILPEDFAAIARQQEGVSRALAFNNHLLREEILLIEAGSTTTLAIADSTTGTPFVIPPGTTNDGVRSIFVNHYEAIAEQGPLGRAPLLLRLRPRTSDERWSLSVSAGGNGSLTVMQRGGEQAVRERAITVAVVGPDGADVSTATKRAVQSALEAVRELNWEVSVIDPTRSSISVNFAAVAWPTYDPQLVQAAAEEALRAFLSPASWGMGERSGEVGETEWVDERVVRYLEVAQVLNAVPGLRYLTALGIGPRSGTDDIELFGLAPVPVPGTITGRVTEG